MALDFLEMSQSPERPLVELFVKVWGGVAWGVELHGGGVTDVGVCVERGVDVAVCGR